jgi:trigger factor
MVTMDVVGHIGESHVVDTKEAAYLVEEESLLPFPGFAQNLMEMEMDVSKEFILDIPEDNTDARLAGKEVHFTVTVKEVKERDLPELDDEFAKGAGDGHDSFAALRESIESDLNEEAERAQAAQYREAVLIRLVEGAKFEFPPMLIDHEIQHMVERRNRFVDQLNVSLDEYLKFTGKSSDEIQQEMREHAVERFSRSYALATLAEGEGLEVSDEEIDEKIQELKSSGEETDQSEAQPGLDSDEARDSIRESMLVAKAVDRLVSIARGESAETGDTDVDKSKEDERPEEGGDKDDAGA